ncbi:dynamin family protein [Halopolyspora algeriensis]|uniref:Dynamin family protein n=1 Tax=Halopolyspora algeriensis TaxID=1500506 RepID=A0A368VY58_9ACTN|nr:dynamin family protein [Halopolyspora algeriensis]RCW47126.1 dynamin family protein [Halopolyspora algeriensis]TQM48213.1 dynamin family protein [Halopolyspora algeriensis]
MSTGAQPHQYSCGPLSTAVVRLCTGLQSQVSAATAAGFHRVLQRLATPLRVAVAGRIKSGKSTLVNALIGRRVAPTGIGECTRLVTRYQYGTVDRVEIVFHDGTKRALPLGADGAVPAALGVALDGVSHLEAYLTNAVLRDLTVIDTPGLGSPEVSSAARAEQVLGLDAQQPVERLDPVSHSAVVGAEAVLYVMTQSVRADDRQALAAFTAATGGRDAGPVNAIAVLNKADTVEPDSVRGSGGDVWQAASLLAGKQAELLKPRVADVLPVVGLLAETAETGGFTATDAEALHALARLDPAVRETLLLSADLFTDQECDIPTRLRRGLLERMDLHGIGRALEAIDADPGITTGALRRAVLDSSGLASVTSRLDSAFRARADGIKAAAGLTAVSALARNCGDRDEQRRIHDAVEELLARPEAHQLRLLEALTMVTSGTVPLPDDLVEEVLRVGSTVDVGERLGLPGHAHQELVDSALERASWWRSFASLGATPAQSRVAHVVHRTYFLIWRRLTGSGDVHGAV